MAVKNDRQHIIFNPDTPYIGIRACRDNCRRVAMETSTVFIETEKQLTKEDAERILRMIGIAVIKPEMIRGCE